MDNVYNAVNNANKYIQQSIQEIDKIKQVEINYKAIKEYESFLINVDIRDYLLLDSNPTIPKDILLESYYNTGNLYKTIAEINNHTNIENFKKNVLLRSNIKDTNNIEEIFKKSISCFLNILRIKFEDKNSTLQILSILTQLCFINQNDYNKCLAYLQEALLYDPSDPNIHYNLGFIYQRFNKIELSLIHYKLGISLCKKDNKNLKINCYNGIACIYKSVKQWPEALHYLLKAKNLSENDPDINNSLGSTYTEMRRTDLAEQCYINAIKNYKNTFISTDVTFLLAELHLNYGHMFSYNGDNHKAIDQYNKSIKICPKFLLPFQNKIMNLCYLFDVLKDPMYITKQHKMINNVYKQSIQSFKYIFKNIKFPRKINIGIVSGDFGNCHPVSFFISPFLKNFDNNTFNIFCYSECIVDTNIYNNNIIFKLIKGLDTKTCSDLIYNDNIDILIDLTGHTAFNRLDVFYMAPAPIQITYIGYPFTTGLNNMNYRITDKICDDKIISQPYYSEKLLFLENCFLCYDLPNKLPYNSSVNNKNIKIGCFNRLNKITDSVINFYNEILMNNNNVEFVFKTKALINPKIKTEFLNKFDKRVIDRIVVLDCTITHEDHLLEYNKIDISVDTFPYSGTTTSCESLLMGVPVFTLYDTKFYFHPQNVTASILKNSNLEYFVLYDKNDIHNKIKEIEKNKSIIDKNIIRNKFVNGFVCNKSVYVKNISKLFVDLVKDL